MILYNTTLTYKIKYWGVYENSPDIFVKCVSFL